MIKYFTLDNEKLRNTGKETDQTIWYCVERPNQEEIHQLTHQFEIPSDYITSILDDAENSRTEEFNQSKLTKPALLLLQYPFAKTSLLQQLFSYASISMRYFGSQTSSIH